MNCNQAGRESLALDYLLGRLAKGVAEEFEDHFFACDSCFEEVRTLQALRQELGNVVPGQHPAGSGRRRVAAVRWGWAAALASVAAAGLCAIWIRRDTPPAATALAQPRPAPEAPGPAAGREAELRELARVEPPRFTRPHLRGGTTGAARRFNEAMELYSRADYRGAIAGLETACALDEETPGPRFFLGISYLMAGETGRGAAALRKTIALGDSPYLEEAHFYLAKASLSQGDTAGAERALQAVIQLQGDMGSRARELLDKLLRWQRQGRK